MARQAPALAEIRFSILTAGWTAPAVAAVCTPSRRRQPHLIAGPRVIMRVPIAESAGRTRISDPSFARARWAEIRGWMLLIGAALCIALVAMLSGSARAGVTLEERKLPMRFSWVACEPNCKGWVSAVGIVTADSPSDFDEFARGRDLEGATLVLDSSGGSVNDSIALGRRFRALSMRTTVGNTVEIHTGRAD